MVRRQLLLAVLVFAVGFAVRWYFLCGPILGDDYEEFSVIQYVVGHPPLWYDQLHLRFVGWLPNYLAFLLFGVSETTFLLPSVLVSSSFGVLAYALLLRWNRGTFAALLGALFVASAPFEVVLGTMRANDVFLEWLLALGFTLLVFLEERPVLQGVSVAACLWLGFYVKLWALYAIPPLALYYVIGRRWRAGLAFVVASGVLHGATCLVWKAKLGTYVPFIASHAATYVVKPDEMRRFLLEYPSLMFRGTREFGTTLFGVVPWLLVVLLLVKLVASARRTPLRFGRPDALLLGFYGTFFLLLEFFPNAFKLDAYYSVPRIFRYLAPLSFPLTLHVASMLLDVAAQWRPGVAAPVLFASLLVVNLHQDAVATGPGRVYRENLMAVVRDVREAGPPELVAELTLARWFRELYFDPDRDSTEVVVPYGTYPAQAYERLLRDREPSLPRRTMLVTGLGSYVHYGAHMDGFRLRWFDQPLPPSWKLVKEYGALSYLPRPEPARLWRLDRDSAQLDVVEDVSSIADVTGHDALFTGGMARYDRADYPGARVHFRNP